MAQVTIIGGHGKVAMLAHPLLTHAGHEVTAVIRNPDHVAEVEETGAAARVADVETMDTDAIADLINELSTDILVWSAGAGGGSPERTRAVDHDAAVRSIDAAVAAGVGRYVMVSYFDARPDHGVPEDNPFHTYAEAKAAADAYLQASDVPWTILGPSTLTADPATGQIEATTEVDGEVTGGQVSRADVAAVLADTVARSAGSGSALAGVMIHFNNGAVPISDALDAIADGTPTVKG